MAMILLNLMATVEKMAMSYRQNVVTLFFQENRVKCVCSNLFEKSMHK